jgi:hypothetical protein
VINSHGLFGSGCKALLVAGVLLASGCASVPDNGHRSYTPLAGFASKITGKGSDSDLRKKVEADSFPTAPQAGI